MRLADALGEDRPRYATLSDKQEALGMYLQGHRYLDIAQELNSRYDFSPLLKKETRMGWAKRMGWDEMRNDMEHDLATETREFAKVTVKGRMAEIEEVRQEFLDRMRDKTGQKLRGFEFAKLTQMLEKMQVREDEKQELVEFINECIRRALQVVDMDEVQQRVFLEKYIELLRAGLS